MLSEEQKEKRRAYMKMYNPNYYQKNAPSLRRASVVRARLRKSGWSSERYDEMMSAQEGCCAICGDSILVQRAHADHDHSTGEPRGLLCNKCNAGIGMFREDPDIFAKALEYLESYGRA